VLEAFIVMEIRKLPLRLITDRVRRQPFLLPEAAQLKGAYARLCFVLEADSPSVYLNKTPKPRTFDDRGVRAESDTLFPGARQPVPLPPGVNYSEENLGMLPAITIQYGRLRLIPFEDL
jgi:hypothetical protein